MKAERVFWIFFSLFVLSGSLGYTYHMGKLRQYEAEMASTNALMAACLHETEKVVEAICVEHQECPTPKVR